MNARIAIKLRNPRQVLCDRDLHPQRRSYRPAIGFVMMAAFVIMLVIVGGM